MPASRRRPFAPAATLPVAPVFSVATTAVTTCTRLALTATVLLALTTPIPLHAAPTSPTTQSPPTPTTSPTTTTHPTLHFESLSFEDGVSHDLVYCMHQDAIGFLWFGTMHGLERYDGVDFVTFRHDPDDSTSLSNDDIVCIAEATNGDLWLGTYGGGVNRYDRAAGTFDRYLMTDDPETSLAHPIIWDLAVAPDGTVWIATQDGLDHLDPTTKRITHYVHDEDDPNSLVGNTTRTLIVDAAERVWIGTEHGLDRFRGEGAGFAHYGPVEGDDASLPGWNATSFCLDDEGRLFVGLLDAGLTRYDPAIDGFVRFAMPETIDAFGSARTIEAGRTGEIWVGTFQGIVRFDPATGTMKRYAPSPDDPTSLHGRQVTAICHDTSGVLWVSCYHEGVDRVVPGMPRFTRYAANSAHTPSATPRTIASIVEDREGTLWMATSGGLVARNGIDGDSRSYRPDPKDPHAIGRGVHAVALAPDGHVWIGAGNDLFRYDRVRDRFDAFRTDPADSLSLTPGPITVLHFDRAGRFWVGTANGLNLYDPTTNRATRFTHDPNVPGTLSDNTILALYDGRSGNLWAGTYAGVNRLAPGDSTFTHFGQDPRDPKSLMNNYVYSLYEDPTGALWLGTGGGLDRFDPKTETFHGLREEDGLPSSVVCGILPDDRGNLWLSTHRGLSCFDPVHHTFSNFDPSDGLQSNFFEPGAYATTASGHLIFGGIHGYNAFIPAAIRRNEHAPAVTLTGIRAAGLPRFADAAFVDELNLRYDESAFTIEFAALDTQRPAKNLHSYRLEGLDDDWIDAGRKRSASYTSVPPGNYVFRVRGANADGVWSESAVALPIHITPPFWRTAWFLALATVTVLTLAFAFHQQRVRGELRHFQEVQRARGQERESVRRLAAEDFHDELGHRITKIGLFSEMVRRKLSGTAPELDLYLEKIVTESRRLASDTRDFLWTLRTGDSLHDLLTHLADFGTELFDRTDVEFRAEGLDPRLRAVELTHESRRHISSIFKEAMNNALRHAECRHVALAATVEGESFTVSLVDDGKGYLRSLAHTGSGLKNMELRAKKIDGTIRIASEPGAGSRITLTRRARQTTGP